MDDRDAFDASIELLLDQDFDRVIMSHGHALETGGKEAMREAFGK